MERPGDKVFVQLLRFVLRPATQTMVVTFRCADDTTAEIEIAADCDAVVTSVDNLQLARIARLAGAPKVQGAGVDLLHVPYNGFAPVVQAILGGQVDVAIITAGVAMPLVKSLTLTLAARAVSRADRRVNRLCNCDMVTTGSAGPKGVPSVRDR